MFRNLCRALVLTYERDVPGASHAEGRIRTTRAKAKEARPFIEKLVTTAIKAKRCQADADKLRSNHARGSDDYKAWRASEAGQAWLKAQAKYIHRRRQLFDVLRSHRVITVLIDVIAPRFLDRAGGYTRIVHLARPRLADGARLSYLEFVGEATRLKKS